VDGFDNNAAAQSLTEKHLGGFVDAAEALAAGLLRDPRRRDSVVGCSPAGADREACVRAFVTRFGRRAYRRPLEAAEVEGLVRLASTAAADADPHSGIELALQAMLGSANFLLVVESGQPDPQRPGVLRLGGYEVASRLAFLLWGAGPDDALLDAAAAGRLDTPDGVASTARTILADPRAAESRRRFFQQWLLLDELREAKPDAKKYPAWNEALGRAMEEETLRFADDLATRKDASLLDLVTADSSFVNAPLAKLYGVSVPASGWGRVSLPQRGAGVLTQASFLTLTTPHEGVEPIKRGQYVRTMFLCERLPSPPADVPSLDEAKVPANATDRERLAAHREVPACSGCHQLLDPVGFGLARFDGIGAYRERDARGGLIDARGSLLGLPEPDFDGPRELGQRLRATPALGACLATQLLRYAVGRTETDDDACVVEEIADRFARAGHGWDGLVEAVVRSDAFRFRRPIEGGAR
jgi:hypothetical protein